MPTTGIQGPVLGDTSMAAGDYHGMPDHLVNPVSSATLLGPGIGAHVDPAPLHPGASSFIATEPGLPPDVFIEGFTSSVAALGPTTLFPPAGPPGIAYEGTPPGDRDSDSDASGGSNRQAPAVCPICSAGRDIGLGELGDELDMVVPDDTPHGGHDVAEAHRLYHGFRLAVTARIGRVSLFRLVRSSTIGGGGARVDDPLLLPAAAALFRGGVSDPISTAALATRLETAHRLGPAHTSGHYALLRLVLEANSGEGAWNGLAAVAAGRALGHLPASRPPSAWGVSSGRGSYSGNDNQASSLSNADGSSPAPSDASSTEYA